MNRIEEIMNQCIVDSCMKETESYMIEYHKEIKHAVKLRAENKISDKDYITMAAKSTAKFVKLIAVDTSANCEAIASAHEHYFNV